MAKKWRKISNLSPQQAASIQDQFGELFLAARGPKGAALFALNERDARTTLFFSPGATVFAEALIAAHKGAACPKPDWASAFLLGNTEDNDMIPVGKAKKPRG